MAVNLTVSKTIDGAAVSDSLAGGGTGVDIGSVVNNQYGPIISKAANTGQQHIYVRHDATIDQITAFSVFVQEYGAGTLFTYGGADTAPNDYATLANLGNASGSSKNNADGVSGGLWVDMEADVATINKFDQAARPTLVKIFGDNGGTSGDGIDIASAFLVESEAMVWDNASVETNGSSPVDGQIGKANDTVLGDNAHLQFRLYLPNAHPDGGILQWETVFSYSFTAALMGMIGLPFFKLIASAMAITSSLS
jgi:hypothetical protein